MSKFEDTPVSAVTISMFAVRDLKAGTYGQPFALSNRQVAMRTFTTWVSNPESFFSKFPHDFELYQVGNFDQVSGRLITFDLPDYVCRASDLVGSAT